MWNRKGEADWNVKFDQKIHMCVQLQKGCEQLERSSALDMTQQMVPAEEEKKEDGGGGRQVGHRQELERWRGGAVHRQVGAAKV